MATVKNPVVGHICSAGAALVWSAGLIMTQRLHEYATASQITAMRFVLGYLALLLIRPHIMRLDGLLREVKLFFIGILGAGGFMYLSSRSISASDTTSGVTLTLACVPLTALVIMCVCGRKHSLSWLHLPGFACGIAGTAFVLSGGIGLQIDLSGTAILTFGGMALALACYSVVLEMHSGSDVILTARRTVFWAMAASIVLMFVTDGLPDFTDLLRVSSIGYLFFTGTLGCGAAFALWNIGLKSIGADVAVNYLYIAAVCSLAFAAFILHSAMFSAAAITGAVLIAAGTVISVIASRTHN